MGYVEFVDAAGEPDEHRRPADDAVAGQSDSVGTGTVPRRLLGTRGTWLAAGAGVLVAGAVLAVVVLGGTSAARAGTQRPAHAPATPSNVGWYTQATEDPSGSFGLSSLRECQARDSGTGSGRADDGTGDPAAGRISLDPCPSGAAQQPAQVGPPTN